MKQLKAVTGPTQAFINVLVATIIFYLNKEKDKSPLLPLKLKSQLQGWVTQAGPFVSGYKMNTKAWKGFTERLIIQKADDDLDDFCDDLIDSFKSRFKLISADISISSDQLSMLKDEGIFLSGGSPSALSRIRKNLNKVGVAADLMEEFKIETESQEPYLLALKPLVKKLTGVEGYRISQEILPEIREKKPVLYKKYLDLRKTVNSIYKNNLVNMVRDNGGKPVDVDKARKQLEKDKVHHNLPKGFKGFIGEDGQLYTTAGKRIDGVPQYPVVMNPNYDPKTDNGNVFTVTLPTTDSNGKNNVQHFYTTGYRQAKTAEKFELVNTLIANLDKHHKKWLLDMRNPNYEIRIPATIVATSFLTCIRIGTVGNATKGAPTEGLTTLKVGNIKKRGTSRVIDYVGKDAVHQITVIAPLDVETRAIVKMIDELCEGKQRKDMLFDYDGKYYSAAKVRLYWKSITGSSKFHKIRTLRGTVLASELLEKAAEAVSKKRVIDQKVVDAAFKAALTEVGALLGHVRGVGTNQKVTWATAAASYVDPPVQRAFYAKFAAKGVRVPAFLIKKLKED